MFENPQPPSRSASMLHRLDNSSLVVPASARIDAWPAPQPPVIVGRNVSISHHELANWGEVSQLMLRGRCHHSQLHRISDVLVSEYWAPTGPPGFGVVQEDSHRIGS